MEFKGALATAFALAMLTLCSCMSPTYRMYKGPAKPTERIAVLSEPYNSIDITAVDGKPILSCARRVELCPGPYLVKTAFRKYLTRYFPGGYTWLNIYSPRTVTLLVELEAGHQYTFGYEMAAANDPQLKPGESLSDDWFWNLPQGKAIGSWHPLIHDTDSAAPSPSDTPSAVSWMSGWFGPDGRSDEDIARAKAELKKADRLMRRKEYNQALFRYARAIEPGLDEQQADPAAEPTVEEWLQTALKLWAMSYRDAAEACVQRAFALDSQPAYCWAARACMLAFEHGHYQEALDGIDRSLGLEREAQCLRFRGAILEKLDRPDEARAARAEADAAEAAANAAAPPPVVTSDPPPALRPSVPQPPGTTSGGMCAATGAGMLALAAIGVALEGRCGRPGAGRAPR